MTIDERGTTILLTNKKDGGWYQLQFNSTKAFKDMDEWECKEALEEMIYEIRKLVESKIGLIEKPES